MLAHSRRSLRHGSCFYEARPLRFHNIMHDEVVGVHHNWIRGDGSKYSRAAAYRVLATEAASRREFVDGARAAMTSMPAWSLEGPRGVFPVHRNTRGPAFLV